VGAIGGMSVATTFYVGLVVEVMPLKEFGLVAEFVQPLGGILAAPPSFNVGVKLSMVVRRLAYETKQGCRKAASTNGTKR
jgi:hypothetical protein